MYNKHRLKGNKLRIENDTHYRVRLRRKTLLKHLWEARKLGESAFLVHNEIKINNSVFDLEHFEKNINQGAIVCDVQGEVGMLTKRNSDGRDLEQQDVVYITSAQQVMQKSLNSAGS